MRWEDRKLRQATREYLHSFQFNDPCAVTVTMKQRVGSITLDEIACPVNFRHFSNRLNKAILRNSYTRYGNLIPIIPALERSHSQRYHYHTVIDRTAHVTRDKFKDIVADCWDRTYWGYREIHFQFDMTPEWIDYITKSATKDYDPIDWQNLVRDC
jgi:hypothetical protein